MQLTYVLHERASAPLLHGLTILTLTALLAGGCGAPAPDAARPPCEGASCGESAAGNTTTSRPPTTTLVANPRDPLGTWYLSAEGARLTLAITRGAAAGSYAGVLITEADGVATPLAEVAWDAATHKLTFRSDGAGERVWYLGTVVEGVLTGRFARATGDSVPAATDYRGHVTGWNASVIDRDVVPRVFDLHWADGRRGRLRIDRAETGAERFVGTLKVYATDQTGAAGEGEEYDLDAVSWDGTDVSFSLTDHFATWQYAGVAHGRTIRGVVTQPGCNCDVAWDGTRAEVLGHGLVARAREEREAWQVRTRAELLHLMMADAPLPAAITVHTLSADQPPIAMRSVPDERDDDVLSARDYTLTELQFEYALTDPRGGPAIVRRSHAYMARPNAPPPPGGYPVAIAVNGHGGGARQMMDPSNWYWYGDGYARRGYLVLAVDVSHRPLEDRHGVYTDALYGDDPANGNGLHPAIASAGFDTDWEEDGERAWDAMRALDYALAQPDVNPERVLVTGLSMGGEVSTLVGALDPRVRFVVPAGFSPDLSVMRYHGNHPCWRWAYADVGEYVDVSDYHALVAPRVLVVETGKSDTTYSGLAAPFAGDKQVLRRSRVAWGETAHRLIHYLHEGGHTYRVGDPGRDSDYPHGVEVPALVAPDAPDSLVWQTDATTIQRRASVFDITRLFAPRGP